MARNDSAKTVKSDKRAAGINALWAGHNAAWRDCAQVVSHWQDAEVNPDLLKYRVSGRFWEVLQDLQITLLVGREYEHLLVALSCSDKPLITHMPMPHPSGIVVQRESGVVYVASTRNPNQIFELAPAIQWTNTPNGTGAQTDMASLPLIPRKTMFFPGSLYMHDLALINGKLHANAVGQNSIIKIEPDGSYKPVWWPACIDSDKGPDFSKNYLQLNSIAAGPAISSSYFSASSAQISSRRPGHKNYPVDKKGVIFSGKTREIYAQGLTRPHSARLHRTGKNGGKTDILWVDNSGYGEVGFIANGDLQVVTRLPGWTRGLAFVGDIAFVGTSRVIPKFSQYAPGLDVSKSVCGIHAIDTKSGKVLGSMVWPSGNQIFAIDWLPVSQSSGLAFSAGSRNKDKTALFYSYKFIPKESL